LKESRRVVEAHLPDAIRIKMNGGRASATQPPLPIFYSKSVLRKSSKLPTVKSRIANAPIIFFGVDRAMNRMMNITARIEREARSTLRMGMRMSFVKP
jgi:hypothetical protein